MQVCKIILVTLALVLSTCACAGPVRPETTRDSTTSEGCVENFEPDTDYFADKTSPRYADGWEVRYESNYKVVSTTVTAGSGHAADQSRVLDSTYVLVQCGTPAPELTDDLAGATVIDIPVTTMVDGGSIFYGALEVLGIPDTLVGHAEPFIGEVEAPYFPQVSAHIDSGAVSEVGYEVNLETLAELGPDFYTNYAGDDAMFASIAELAIPVVLYFPYSESPLGAAEQLKFLSLFYNLEQLADDYFVGVEERYLALQERVETEGTERPSVLIGVVGTDGFTTRQNGRFEPQLFREAGGDLIFDLPGGGIETVSLEVALERGANADYWLDLVFFPDNETAADYLAADPRLAALSALEAGNTFHRVGPRGADYFLHGAIDVDLMLADVVSILHPELLPADHALQFLTRIPGA